MNILFSTTYYDPYVSGLSLYVRRLSEELSDRNHSVSVLCMRHENKLAQRQIVHGVRIIRAKPLISLHKGFLSWHFVRLAWQKAKLADVIVVNLPQFEGFWPALFGRIHQKKVIAIYHSELDLPDGFINNIVQTMVEIANALTLYLAEAVVTYTLDFANYSKLLRLVKTKVVTTFPPVPVPQKDTKIIQKLSLKIGKSDIIIGVAARLAAEKGLEYLFEAIPLLKSKLKGRRLKVVIAGPDNPVGERAYRVKIRRMEKRYADYLVFLGEVRPEDMGSFYELIDILVLPSVNSTETFGIVQVEAMMTGVPVVASNLAGVRVPIRTTGMGIVVASRDTRAIADAITTILAEPSKYTKDKEWVRKLFSKDKVIAFYEELFTV